MRFAYEAGYRDDRDEVASDIRLTLANEFSSEELDQFLALLAQDDLVDERVEGIRQRDSVLPNLQGINASIDLRVLAAGSSGISAAPVVTLRLEFDEHVAGQDSMVFQVPVEFMPAVIAGLQDTLTSLRAMTGTKEVSIPAWASPPEPRKTDSE